MERLLMNTLHLALTAAPWLLGGLVAAALIQTFIPRQVMAGFLGGRGLGAVLRAAFIGIPLPLCSCGVLPTAIGLRRQGASKSATTAFLVSTPEIGLDSFALSYALLGPFMALARPVAAFFTAVLAGLMTAVVVRRSEGQHSSPTGELPTGSCGHDSPSTRPVPAARPDRSRCDGGDRPSPDEASASCCGRQGSRPAEDESACCHGSPPSTSSSSPCCGEKPAVGSGMEQAAGWPGRLIGALRYVFTQLLDDIAPWLAVALVVAGVMTTYLQDNQWLVVHGSRWYAMLAMLVVGVPLYVCASASTPLAAGLLAAGLSPGVVLVFLLAGPATNIGSVGVLRKELGTAAVGAYLGAIAVGSVAAGVVVNALASAWSVDIGSQVAVAGHGEHLPYLLTVPAAVVLAVLALRPVRAVVWSVLSGGKGGAGDGRGGGKG